MSNDQSLLMDLGRFRRDLHQCRLPGLYGLLPLRQLSGDLQIPAAEGGENRPLKIYIAGKITGNPNYREEFSAAENWYAKEWWVVLNPALLPPGLGSQEAYMALCIPMLFTADHVVFLPTWRESAGAKLELALCQYIGKPYSFLENSKEFMEMWRELHDGNR